MFYVYEHWRLDKDECFYVGKGHGDRAYSRKNRNSHWRNIVSKLERTGYAYEVRIVSSNLTEDEAFSLEIERIGFWRDKVDLANLASGGGINSGWKLSEERKKLIGESKKGNKYRLGAKLSSETKIKISNSHKGKELSEEHKSKLSLSLSGERNPFFGKKHSKETGKKISESNKKRIWTEESKQKLSKTLKGRPHIVLKKWKHSEGTKAKMRLAAKARWEKRKNRIATCDA